MRVGIFRCTDFAEAQHGQDTMGVTLTVTWQPASDGAMSSPCGKQTTSLDISYDHSNLILRRIIGIGRLALIFLLEEGNGRQVCHPSL